MAGLVYGGLAGNEQHVVLLKYAANGDLAWSKIDPTARAGAPVRVAISQGGGIVVGTTTYTRAPSQYRVFAVDPAGNSLWESEGSDPSPMELGSLALGPSGEIVIGDSYGGQVVKLGPTGAAIWTRNRLIDYEQVSALSIDPSGDIAVAYGPGTCRVAKLSSAGDPLWSTSLAGETVWPTCLASRSAPDGRVYAAGSYWDSTLGSLNAFVVAFDGAGQVRWARSHASSGGGPASFRDLVLDGTGRLWAAGYTSTPATSSDVLIQSMTDDPTSPLGFHTVAPCRAFDSRDAALGGPAAVRPTRPSRPRSEADAAFP